MRRPLDPGRPVFIGNPDGDTLARVTKTHLPALRSEDRAPSHCRSLSVGAAVSKRLALHATVLRALANSHRFRRGSSTA